MLDTTHPAGLRREKEGEMERLIDLLRRIMATINRNDERSDEFQSKLIGIRSAACCLGVIIETVVNGGTDDYDYVGFYITQNRIKTYYEL